MRYASTVAAPPRDLVCMISDPPEDLRTMLASPRRVNWNDLAPWRGRHGSTPTSTTSTRAGTSPKASRRMEALRLSVRLLSELTRAIGEGRHDDASRARQALETALGLVSANR